MITNGWHGDVKGYGGGRAKGNQLCKWHMITILGRSLLWCRSIRTDPSCNVVGSRRPWILFNTLNAKRLLVQQGHALCNSTITPCDHHIYYHHRDKNFILNGTDTITYLPLQSYVHHVMTPMHACMNTTEVKMARITLILCMHTTEMTTITPIFACARQRRQWCE